MTVWNYGILLRGIAQKDPNRLAQVFGEDREMMRFTEKSGQIGGERIDEMLPLLGLRTAIQQVQIIAELAETQLAHTFGQPGIRHMSGGSL